MPFCIPSMKIWILFPPVWIWPLRKLSWQAWSIVFPFWRSALAPYRDVYDYMIIDCPPSLGLVTTNALTAADTLLVPIQCEYYALEGLSQLMNTVRRVKRQYNSQLEIEGVLLTMFDGRLNLTQQVVQEVKKYFPRKVFATVIPRAVRLSEAPSFGCPIQYFDKKQPGRPKPIWI